MFKWLKRLVSGTYYARQPQPEQPEPPRVVVGRWYREQCDKCTRVRNLDRYEGLRQLTYDHSLQEYRGSPSGLMDHDPHVFHSLHEVCFGGTIKAVQAYHEVTGARVPIDVFENHCKWLCGSICTYEKTSCHLAGITYSHWIYGDRQTEEEADEN